MGRSYALIDRFAVSMTRLVMQYRWVVIIVAILGAAAIGSGARYLEFSNNYRAFFSDNNPELAAFESLQSTYTKSDNFLFVVTSNEGVTRDVVMAVEELTEAAWQIPFSLRVDSITNFQHTYGVEDDLIVEDLISDAGSLAADELDRRLRIAQDEPLLLEQLINSDRTATAVNVVLQYPEKSLAEVPEAVTAARMIKADIHERFPGVQVSITGMSMLNNAFAEIGTQDLSVLMPLMFGIIMLLSFLILRSAAATAATLLVIVLSTTVGMGMAGHLGIDLTPVSAMAPVVILTLAIADSIHILISFRSALRQGMHREAALTESVRLNLVPVSVTSLTTIVGFLALNFSDAPPFWHLGNITAMGIAAAWVLSLTLLPAMVRLLPFRSPDQAKESYGERMMGHLAEFVIARPKILVSTIGVLSLVLVSFIPQLALNDSWTKYFDDSTEFRQDTDAAMNFFGMYQIEYSVPATEPGGVSEPDYLQDLQRFSVFLRQQPEVKHVYSLSDIMRRLNKNLHGDDDSYFTIPMDRDLAAQYLLLYELSLPYGLDLNDRINIDKSATRVTATLQDVDSIQTKGFLNRTRAWMHENLPASMQAHPTSAQVMFTYIAERNVNSMTGGTVAAIFAIALILVLTLRNLKLGLLSLVPNGLPILITFGIWSILVGAVGFSVATVASISLGIIVDDTVHLLSKYVRAREERNEHAADAIRYAFRSVGVALIVNTFILTAGFLVMLTSSFKVNVDMGLLTAIAIVLALVLDFLFLPALLLLFDNKSLKPNSEGEKEMKSNNPAIAGISVVMLLAGTIASSLLFAPAASAEVTAPRGDSEAALKGFEIAARADRTDRGFGDSEVEMEMVLRNAAGQESLRSLKFLTLEVPDENVGDKSLVLFGSPRDIQGTALLSYAKILTPDDQWLYLPALKRVKRISSANKSGPFVGSEFAFEDFTSLELNKYDYLYLRQETVDGMAMDVVERIPRYKNSGYTRQVSWVDQDIYQIRKVEFYDRRGDLLKTLHLQSYREYDGIWRSQKLTMVNHKTGKSTDMIYQDYRFGVGLTDNDFVKGKLSRMR
jgi:uncharacterized protein